MPEVFIGIGANIQPRENINKALALLEQHLHAIDCSPAYQNAAIGFVGPPFINLVVRFLTHLRAVKVQTILKQIEHRCGRTTGAERFASRTMDLDLLLYGDCIIDHNSIQVPRHEILQHAYVLKPLSDLNPHGLHPLTGECYIDLWRAMREHEHTSLQQVFLQ